MEWKEAIQSVLKVAKEPLHYAGIAEEVAERRLRNSNELGATPANTVYAVIWTSLRDEGDRSPFVKTGRGFFALRGSQQELAPPEVVDSASSPVSGVVNAFGMFWERSKVVWATEPRLLGQQQTESQPVDFCKQIGVYLLHDAQGVVYVGRVTDQTLGRRLNQHTADRLGGRWNRFSWFGVYPVQNDGTLRTTADFAKIGIEIVIATMEAVLIEGLEPRQNRRRGEDFQAVEFLQVEDPDLEMSRKFQVVQELASQFKIKR